MRFSPDYVDIDTEAVSSLLYLAENPRAFSLFILRAVRRSAQSSAPRRATRHVRARPWAGRRHHPRAPAPLLPVPPPPPRKFPP